MKIFSAKKFIEEKEHIYMFSGNEKLLIATAQYDGLRVTDVSRFMELYIIEIEEETVLLSKIDCSVHKKQWQQYKKE